LHSIYTNKYSNEWDIKIIKIFLKLKGKLGYSNYVALSKVLYLPSYQLLNSYKERIPTQEPGFDPKFIADALKDVKEDTNVFLTFDAIYIKQGLIFKNDQLIGFVDIGEDKSKNNEINNNNNENDNNNESNEVVDDVVDENNELNEELQQNETQINENDESQRPKRNKK
jgi:hypothetical protein